MFDDVGRIGFVLLLGSAAVAPAQADGPGPNFKLRADDTIKSPDQRLCVEQYFRDTGDDGFLFQFWIFDNTHRHGFPLNADEGTDLAGYPAGFRFSPDSQWLVRIEDWRCVYDLKTGAFSVPESFADYNATAVKTPDSDRK